MQLLKTNNRIDDSPATPPRRQFVPEVAAFRTGGSGKGSRKTLGGSAGVEQGESSLSVECPYNSDKSMVSTNNKEHLKSSAAFSHYYGEPKVELVQPDCLPSETNLLDSEQTIPRPRDKMKLSRCVEVQIAVEETPNEFDGLFQMPRGTSHVESDCSFGGRDAGRRRLR